MRNKAFLAATAAILVLILAGQTAIAEVVQITYPNGGESLIAGTVHSVTWSSNVSNVKIEYSSNNGTDWAVIDANTPSDGQYDWTVPEVDSDQCLVRISDASDAGVEDVSDAVFSIEIPCFPVCHPDFDEWVSVGMPDSWCNPRQCKGEFNNAKQGSSWTGYYWVGSDDNDGIHGAWKTKEPPEGPGIDRLCAPFIPCIAGDYDHRAAGSPYIGYYRIGITDMCIYGKYFQVKEPDFGPGIGTDCLECASEGAAMEGPNLHLRIDTGGGFYDPGETIVLDLDQVVTIGIENLTSDQYNWYDAYVEMTGDLPGGQWTGTTWIESFCDGWTYFGTSVLSDRDAWLVEASTIDLSLHPSHVGVSASVEYQKVGYGETTIIVYNEYYEEVDTLTISSPECLTPETAIHPDTFLHIPSRGTNYYQYWVDAGQPECWCYPKQCHGDADGKAQGSTWTGFYHVGSDDLNVLFAAWMIKEPTFGTGLDGITGPKGTPAICADFNHAMQGSPWTGYYRVGSDDLNLIFWNWQVKEPTFGSGVPADCGGTLVP